MAIKEIKQGDSTITGDGNVAFQINNGDLKSLDELRLKWKIKDRENFLRFMLAAFALAEDKEVYIGQNGDKIKIFASDDIVEKDADKKND